MLTWWHHIISAPSAAHSRCQSPVLPHPKGAVLDTDQGIEGHLTRRCVHETSLRQIFFLLCDTVRYRATIR